MELTLSQLRQRINKKDKSKLNQLLAEQIDNYCAAIEDGTQSKGEQLEELFAAVTDATNVHRQSRRSNKDGMSLEDKSQERLANLRKGQGLFNFSVAVYYWFHLEKERRKFGEAIDEEIFGRPLTGILKDENVNSDKSIGTKPKSNATDSVASIQAMTEPLLRDAEIYGVTATNKSQKPLVLIALANMMLNNLEDRDFFYKLDYESDDVRGFRFDPEKFPLSNDERCLDSILHKFSVIGRLYEVGYVEKDDIEHISYQIKAVLQNKQVFKYFEWLLQSDQIPDHTEFRSAILLYSVIIGKDEFYKSYESIYNM